MIAIDKISLDYKDTARFVFMNMGAKNRGQITYMTRSFKITSPLIFTYKNKEYILANLEAHDRNQARTYSLTYGNKCKGLIRKFIVISTL